MFDQNLPYQIGMTLIKGIGNITAKQIIEYLGEPEQLFKEKARTLERIPGITPRVIAEIRNPNVLKQAAREIDFMRKNNIKPLFLTDPDYPSRLRECLDSPVMMYYLGKGNLNVAKIISIVGTRNATAYGREITERIVQGLAEAIPDMLVVSGLAYGTDYNAHQAALKAQLGTVGILAHGLDRIYPYQHLKLAQEMLDRGGLLTDFMSGTNPDRQNFVKRNRIIAGISDCTLVVESAEKGGALITAHIADSYNKDVFAIPGKAVDIYSQGCNRLIKDRKAVLVESADDILQEMRWIKLPPRKAPEPVQQSLFAELPPDSQQILTLLAKSETTHLNVLSVELNIPINKLSAKLFELEMDGFVQCLPGGMYRVK
ncbi:MAG: DNA-processing protein DprA [Dysgonamonadaceae bacterium]|nr:DNA-processing protein DprA [Dysgonamonadaceae bacterium]